MKRSVSWQLGLLLLLGLAGCGGTPDGGDGRTRCTPVTCAELGWACGYMVTCGQDHDCADEGLACAEGEICTGGIDGPTQCGSGVAACPLCPSIPDCTGQPQLTQITGRVVTPGRTDGNTGNQVGVPNALVYILRDNNVADLPAIPSGIPAGEASCDRCEDQAPVLGPVLSGAVTDATGHFTIEGDIPVGVDFLLVTKAGRFRRATVLNIPSSDACLTTTLPENVADNPTRIPRSMSDGLAVNFPRVAVSTGRIDAMECVFEKIGIDHGEFGNFGESSHIELYRGAEPGAQAGTRIDGSTPHSEALYGDLARLESYDIVVADCEGTDWDSDFSERVDHGDNVRSYLNRGGRLFASHLSFTWLHDNGTTPYDAATAVSTGLGQAATWDTTANNPNSGTGIIAFGRPQVSSRIDHFADWMVNEGVTTAPNYDFPITQPRTQAESIGSQTEEFVYTEADSLTQQFSFDTPYGAPAGEGCGRVAYSGFHVAAMGPDTYASSIFPDDCGGDLTDQEKVLLYMLFDLGTCVGNPLPPPCVPLACTANACGRGPDGCGGIRDCGPCPLI